MRRTTLLAAQLARHAGALSAGAEPATTSACAAAGQQLRRFAAGGEPPKVVPNPLQQIVPPAIKGIGAAVDGLKAGASALAEGLASGPATRGAIAYFADKVLLSGTFVSPSELDVPKWAAWLAASGYANKEGWDKLVEGIKANVHKLEPCDVEALVPALHALGRFDRQLFESFADIVKARFTEFETPGLARVLPVFAAHDLFDQQLWDDAADSVAYCNHYLAPNVTPLADIAALFAAYAKYGVDRGDLFVTLARCIHEDRLKALGDAELKEVVGSLLASFKALAFYPDATQALIVAARLRPAAVGPAEQAVIADVEAALRDQAPDGKLSWLDGGFKDWEHFHGSPFGSYNLWVAREELAPQYYRPSDISPRPPSMSHPVPEPAAAGASASS